MTIPDDPRLHAEQIAGQAMAALVRLGARRGMHPYTSMLFTLADVLEFTLDALGRAADDDGTLEDYDDDGTLKAFVEIIDEICRQLTDA